MRPLNTAVVILVIHLMAALDSCPAAIVVPNALAAVEGNSNNTNPFGNTFFADVRYQQVYRANQFSGSILIGQIAFRPDASFGSAFSTVSPDIQINLSTTSRNPDALSATFSQNVGVDDTVVYNRGPLPLSTANAGGGLFGPRDFDIVITLTTPFLYNPSQGNLLLDVRNFRVVTTTSFDAEDTAGDPVSRVYGRVNDVTAPFNPDTIGLVTQFLPPPPTQPIPEPTSLALLGFGSFALALGSVYRRFRGPAR
jgi:hypothetical protein